MAIAMATVIIAGFSLSIAMGRSSFAAPLIFHAHAAIFLSWLGLYLVQTELVVSGNVQLHQRLGWLSFALIPAMLAMGTALTLHSVRQTGGPPFFDTNEFLFGNPIGLVTFAALALGGIAMRRRADWHRRLMLCAMASITGPGFGRLLPMPFLIPWAWWISALFVPAIFPIIGLIRDKRRTGRVHSAWLVGLATMFAGILIGDLIAYSPVGYSITHAVIDGTPGAQREMRAHFP